MSEVYENRRRFLVATTSFVAIAGAATATIPLIRSWQPSARARVAGAPVKVRTAIIEPGRMITVKWRGKPVWVLKRTQKNLDMLAQPDHRNNLRDPDSSVNQQPEYAKNEYRSLRPDIFVTVGICTHLGCVPTYVPGSSNSGSLSIYFCPCHGSKFDLAGRVFKDVPAPTNLIIPPYQYLDGETIEIGIDSNTE